MYPQTPNLNKVNAISKLSIWTNKDNAKCSDKIHGMEGILTRSRLTHINAK